MKKVAELVLLLVTGLTRALLSSKRHYYSQLILHEQLEPTENYDLIYSNLIRAFSSSSFSFSWINGYKRVMK